MVVKIGPIASSIFLSFDFENKYWRSYTNNKNWKNMDQKATTLQMALLVNPKQKLVAHHCEFKN